MTHRVLINIEWRVSDIDLDFNLGIDGENLDREDFLEGLSQILMLWTPYPNDPTSIIFLYHLTSHEAAGSNVIDLIPVETMKYPISSLPTALEVIGAISTYYDKEVLTQQVPELFGNNDLLPGRPGLFTSTYPRFELLGGSELFKGLRMVQPGVYDVVLRSD